MQVYFSLRKEPDVILKQNIHPNSNNIPYPSPNKTQTKIGTWNPNHDLMSMANHQKKKLLSIVMILEQAETSVAIL